MRLLGRLLALVAATIVSLGVAPWDWAAVTFPAASPFVSLAGSLARRSFEITVVFSLPFLALLLWRRRWICRYFCPTGFLNEQAGRLRGNSRYAYRTVPHVGRFLALAALGAAAVGFPLVLWLDPFSLFGGAIGAARPPFAWLSAIPAAGLAAVLLLSEIWPGLWCRRLCPLGATQELLFALRLFFSSHRRPLGVVSARRTALAAGLGALAAFLVPRRAAAGKTSRIRPPGAMPEDQFVSLCSRCGNCTRACPSKIISPDLMPDDWLGLFAPRVAFGEDFCRYDCRRCTEVCPSGAIARLSLEEKQQFVIGLAAVNRKECLLANGLECGYCLGACPCEAIEIVHEAENPLPAVRTDRCIGCGACESVCPVGPPKAIVVRAATPYSLQSNAKGC